MFYPSYLKLHQENKLSEIAQKLFRIYSRCDLCPRNCLKDRNQGETGFCSSGNRVRVYSAHPHLGEEAPLTGRYGSGTIFFSACNLLCAYCQNGDISHGNIGDLIEDQDLAEIMLRLQNAGCHNINLVTPTHFLPNIVNAIDIAAGRGLNLPIVYNTGGYEKTETLAYLNGIVDIYLPDMKYSNSDAAQKYSKGAADYPEKAFRALKEMHAQVGILKTDSRGIAQQGLMIRHLILPNDLAGTKKFLQFVATSLHTNTYINIMDQYRPAYKAHLYPELSRRISADEYKSAISLAHAYGLSS